MRNIGTLIFYTNLLIWSYSKWGLSILLAFAAQSVLNCILSDNNIGCDLHMIAYVGVVEQIITPHIVLMCLIIYVDANICIYDTYSVDAENFIVLNLFTDCLI